jgi:hypothetical protein
MQCTASDHPSPKRVEATGRLQDRSLSTRWNKTRFIGWCGALRDEQSKPQVIGTHPVVRRNAGAITLDAGPVPEMDLSLDGDRRHVRARRARAKRVSEIISHIEARIRDDGGAVGAEEARRIAWRVRCEPLARSRESDRLIRCDEKQRPVLGARRVVCGCRRRDRGAWTDALHGGALSAGQLRAR